MSDVAEPGKGLDLLGITVWNKAGGVWFSSNWNGIKTVTQAIAQGNLQVSSNNNLKNAETAINILPATERIDLLVFPNPFSDRLRFEFIAPVDAQARIDLFDMTGRLVNTVFDLPVKAGQDYQADFEPSNDVSGMYFYRATIGEQVFNGKVTYRK
jgi:hypothetical protein